MKLTCAFLKYISLFCRWCVLKLMLFNGTVISCNSFHPHIFRTYGNSSGCMFLQTTRRTVKQGVLATFRRGFPTKPDETDIASIHAKDDPFVAKLMQMDQAKTYKFVSTKSRVDASNCKQFFVGSSASSVPSAGSCLIKLLIVFTKSW